MRQWFIYELIFKEVHDELDLALDAKIRVFRSNGIGIQRNHRFEDTAINEHRCRCSFYDEFHAVESAQVLKYHAVAFDSNESRNEPVIAKYCKISTLRRRESRQRNSQRFTRETWLDKDTGSTNFVQVIANLPWSVRFSQSGRRTPFRFLGS